MLEVTLPCKVLLHHGLALLAVHVQLAPSVGLVVDLPVVRQLQKQKQELFTPKNINGRQPHLTV